MNQIRKIKKNWEIKKHDRNLVETFATELGVEPLTAALLISRGYDTTSKVEEFFHPTLDSLHSPFLLKDIEKAVARILEAIDRREKILIWGDYDVDGTTGTVILRKAFRKLGVEVDYYIPHRVQEGYGLNLEALKKKKEEGIKVIITVDTGSLAFEAAEWARNNGICLIVTDHHIMDKDEHKSKAYALINPHQKDCPYPNKKIAGVGVAFKLAQALLERKGVSDQPFLKQLLELVAVGTIADIMELTGENRSIVKFGLGKLKETENKGLKALIEVAGLKNKPSLSSYNIGFQIAPRINAAGRLEHAGIVVKLLETDSDEEALKIAEILDRTNRERQELQNRMVKEAFEALDESIKPHSEIPFAIVVANKNWHRGVVGLVASKVTDAYYRPSFMISIENDIGYGSARSIEEFDVTEALSKASDILINYGGHKQAAGFSIKSDYISAFKKILNDYASKVLKPENLNPRIIVDAQLSFKSIHPKLWQELTNFEPFGIGNPKPVFLTRSVKINSKKAYDKYTKFDLADREGKKLNAIFWSVNMFHDSGREFYLAEGQTIDVVYELELNVWNGYSSFQLNIKDFKDSQTNNV